MRDEYAWAARAYDPLFGRTLDGWRRWQVRALRDHAAGAGMAPGGDRLLAVDLGCGTGRLAAMLAEAGFQTLGADLSPAMLGKAREHAGIFANMGLVIGDARALPLADGAAFGVTASLALHEMDEDVRDGGLSEVRRVLSPDGVMAVLDYDRPVGLSGRTALLGLHVVERMAGARHYAGFRGFLEQGGVSGWLKERGWQVDVRKRWLGGAMALVLATPA